MQMSDTAWSNLSRDIIPVHVHVVAAEVEGDKELEEQSEIGVCWSQVT